MFVPVSGRLGVFAFGSGKLVMFDNCSGMDSYSFDKAERGHLGFEEVEALSSWFVTRARDWNNAHSSLIADSQEMYC